MLMVLHQHVFVLTVLPDSNDVIPVRNQLLEIDTINTVVLQEQLIKLQQQEEVIL